MLDEAQKKVNRVLRRKAAREAGTIWLNVWDDSPPEAIIEVDFAGTDETTPLDTVWRLAFLRWVMETARAAGFVVHEAEPREPQGFLPPSYMNLEITNGRPTENHPQMVLPPQTWSHYLTDENSQGTAPEAIPLELWHSLSKSAHLMKRGHIEKVCHIENPEWPGRSGLAPWNQEAHHAFLQEVYDLYKNRTWMGIPLTVSMES